jgi:uncharacterized membrane protein YphA (DoxX/SURF4 family)
MNVRLFAAILVSGLVMCNSAAAHVNWFVEKGSEPLRNYGVSDPAFLFWAVIALFLVYSSVWLDEKLPTVKVAYSKLRHDFMELLRVLTGMSFLLTAYEGALVAPHKLADGASGLTLLFLQAVIGIMFIANRWIKFASVAMLILYAGLVLKFGIFPALEYAIVLGIALFFLINYLDDPEKREQWKLYSVDILRIWTGVSLVALALGEKLLPSALGQVFLSQYQWNFLEAMGITVFDDRMFVLAAGMVEAAIGFMLILGTTVRLAVFVLSIMMAISNVVFIMQGDSEAALVELVGHMPIIGVALLLLLLGYGQRLKITNLFNNGQDLTKDAGMWRSLDLKTHRPPPDRPV